MEKKTGKKPKTWFARVVYKGKESVFAYPTKKQRDDLLTDILSNSLYNGMQRYVTTRRDVVKKYGYHYKIDGICVYDPRDPGVLFDAWEVLDVIRYRLLTDDRFEEQSDGSYKILRKKVEDND